MVKRKKVGFIFSYNENWIGGSYYILNIIHALNSLKDDEKPFITILSPKQDDFELVKTETEYPYLSYQKFPGNFNLVQRVINKISNTFLQKNVFHILKNIQFVYPNFSNHITNESIKKTYWIPDFQEEFLPSFFSTEDIKNRKKDQLNISKTADFIVFSSFNAQSHYNALYPISKPNQSVLQFAVTHPDFSKLDTSTILEKHKLPAHFFFAPNQFWAHKNHITILKAIKILKEKGIDIFVALSGKDADYRSQGYVETLNDFIKENKLSKNIAFLGFLDREEQLLILKNSIAVIQPSLFEGWSTVVEDSKAINKFIILSDLDVHKEQISNNCAFFEKNNEKELAQLIEKYTLNKPIYTATNNYQENIHTFGSLFMGLVNSATEK